MKARSICSSTTSIPSVVGQAGSSLARTIRQGVDLLTLTNSGADRALVVMSDGEAFEPVEDVATEAKRAGEQGISLVTVGFGTTDGTTIPIKNPDGSMTTKKDENGNTVVTQYHPEFLKAAADAADGTFIDAGATDKAARVKSALAKLAHADARQSRRRIEDAALSVVPLSGVRAAAARHRAHRATRAAPPAPCGGGDCHGRARWCCCCCSTAARG